MKTSAIIRIVIWSIVALMLTAFLATALVGANIFGFSKNTMSIPFHILNFGDVEYEHADKYSVGGASLPASDITNLDLTWISGSVEVKETSGSEIVFYEKEDAKLKENEKLHWYNNNGTLIIQPLSSNINFPRINKSKSLVLEVPACSKLSGIKLRNVSALVSISSAPSGKLLIDTVSGDVCVSSAVYDELEFSSTSGSLTINNVEAEKADFEAVSGDINIQGSFGNISAEEVSGSILATLTSCPKNFDAETVSGSIVVSLPENSGFTAEFDSASGSLSYDFPLSQNGDRHIYKDGSAKFDFETVSGDATIKKHS